MNAAEIAFVVLAFALAIVPMLGRAIHQSRKK
jgi:hypothetical protein